MPSCTIIVTFFVWLLVKRDFCTLSYRIEVFKQILLSHWTYKNYPSESDSKRNGNEEEIRILQIT